MSDAVHTCPRCHVAKAEGAPCRVCWQSPSSPMADITAACERAIEAAARGPQPGVITDKQAAQVIDIRQRLRERQFAEALRRHLLPGWRLILEPAFGPNDIAFLTQSPDALFAGSKAYAALAPRVAELGGRVAAR